MPPNPKPKHKRAKESGKSPSHVDQIRRLPCLLSGGPAECAHIRMADAAHGKTEAGMGAKPADRWTVPLAPMLHRLATQSQHAGNERAFWEQFGVDPLKVAEQLWEHRHNRVTMERVIIMASPWSPEIKAKVASILRNEKKK